MSASSNEPVPVVNVRVTHNGESYPDISLNAADAPTRIPFGQVTVKTKPSSTTAPPSAEQQRTYAMTLDMPSGDKYQIEFQGISVTPFTATPAQSTAMVARPPPTMFEPFDVTKPEQDVFAVAMGTTDVYANDRRNVCKDDIEADEYDPLALENPAVDAHEDGSLWVMCDRCSKWRRVPAYVDPELLPNQWFCAMNPDPTRASCGARQEDESRRMYRFTHDFCFVCQKTAGDLMGCRGPCMRAFHERCVSLRPSNAEREDWYCDDCINEIHECFICKQGGTDRLDVVKCELHCGRYYHPDCMNGSSEVARRMSFKPITIKKNKPICCPAHWCSTCGRAGSHESLMKCIECPVAYHATSHCRPAGLYVYSKKSFLCPHHHRKKRKRNKDNDVTLTQCKALHPPKSKYPMQLGRGGGAYGSGGGVGGAGGLLGGVGPYLDPLSAASQALLQSGGIVGPNGKPLYGNLNYNDAGQLIMPVCINAQLSILNLGTIVYNRPLFHNDQLIFPVGFKSVHTYPSCVDPTRVCQYISEIIDDTVPLFKVTCTDNPEQPFTSHTPNGVWSLVYRHIVKLNENMARDRARALKDGTASGKKAAAGGGAATVAPLTVTTTVGDTRVVTPAFVKPTPEQTAAVGGDEELAMLQQQQALFQQQQQAQIHHSLMELQQRHQLLQQRMPELQAHLQSVHTTHGELQASQQQIILALTQQQEQQQLQQQQMAEQQRTGVPPAQPVQLAFTPQQQQQHQQRLQAIEIEMFQLQQEEQRIHVDMAYIQKQGNQLVVQGEAHHLQLQSIQQQQQQQAAHQAATLQQQQQQKAQEEEETKRMAAAAGGDDAAAATAAAAGDAGGGEGDKPTADADAEQKPVANGAAVAAVKTEAAADAATTTTVAVVDAEELPPVLPTPVSGITQFGLSSPLVHALIEKMPNAEKCVGYHGHKRLLYAHIAAGMASATSSSGASGAGGFGSANAHTSTTTNGRESSRRRASASDDSSRIGAYGEML